MTETVANPFIAGAQACREMMARFVEQGGDRTTAGSIRANWNPSWGEDPGKLEGSIPNCITAQAEAAKQMEARAATLEQEIKRLRGVCCDVFDIMGSKDHSDAEAFDLMREKLIPVIREVEALNPAEPKP